MYIVSPEIKSKPENKTKHIFFRMQYNYCNLSLLSLKRVLAKRVSQTKEKDNTGNHIDSTRCVSV